MVMRSADVAVVGAGLAGVSAALTAADAGARVLLVAGPPGSSPKAQGGIAAAVGADDSPYLHAIDTLAAGSGLAEDRPVELLTTAAGDAITWLRGLGVPFDAEPSLEAAHSRRRVLSAGGDRSGATIMAALESAVATKTRITVVPERLVSLAHGGVHLSGGAVTASRVVVATGGYAGLFERSTNAPICDGFGMLEAARLGASLADLELIQFHPTVFAGTGSPFLITEAVRGAGAHLLDSNGQRFVDELLNRALVAQAIAVRGTAWLDARHISGQLLREHFAGLMENCRAVGLDPARDLIPVAPGAHYCMGGIVTDVVGRTCVPGLYAAGECARTGVHGANRLASNSLLEAVVFGRRAAWSALADSGPAVALDPPHPPLEDAGATATARHVLGEAAGVVRDGATLKRAAGILSELPDVPAALLSRRIVVAALARPESVGAHVRSDS